MSFRERVPLAILTFPTWFACGEDLPDFVGGPDRQELYGDGELRVEGSSGPLERYFVTPGAESCPPQWWLSGGHAVGYFGFFPESTVGSASERWSFFWQNEEGTFSASGGMLEIAQWDEKPVELVATGAEICTEADLCEAVGELRLKDWGMRGEVPNDSVECVEAVLDEQGQCALGNLVSCDGEGAT